MKNNKKNLILIPAVTRNPVLSFHMSEEERLSQLIGTIKTCIAKIPNSYVVVLEGGGENENDKIRLLNEGANEVFSYDLVRNGKRIPNPNRTKTYGELTLFLEYFSSTNFGDIKENVISISKAGGRILLNENFNFDPSENCVMNYTHTAWSGKGACSGRYWKIPISKFEHFHSRLSTLCKDYIKDESIIDIEHGLYKYNVIPLEGIEPNTLTGASLFVSTIGQWEHN